MWVNLVADVKRRLATAERHCEHLERELAECRSALTAERDACAETEKQAKELRHELDEVEASLADIAEVNNAKRQPPRLSNLTLLYVGGRQAQIGHLRAVAERSGAIFLHHDGGIEERSGLLQGLISRADAVLFPGRLHQSRRDVTNQADMPSVRQTGFAVARSRVGTVLCCVEQAYRIHAVLCGPRKRADSGALITLPSSRYRDDGDYPAARSFASTDSASRTQ